MVSVPCFIAAIRNISYSKFLASIIIGMLGLAVSAMISSIISLNQGTSQAIFNILNIANFFLTITSEIIIVITVIITIIRSGRIGNHKWFAFTLGSTLCLVAIAITGMVISADGLGSIGFVTPVNQDAGIFFGLLLFSSPLPSEVFTLFAPPQIKKGA